MKEIDWSNLSFGYMKTDYNVRINYREGEWGKLEISSSEQISLHMAATCLHYGQEAFEGLKAFRGKDGKVRVFRLEENAARLQSTCRGIMMPELPTERFKEAVMAVVKMNERFIPPYESGASLYIRPLLIGTGAQVGVRPANEYMFLIFVTPVGPYFKGAFLLLPTSLPASTTVPLRWAPASIRWAETMQPVSVPATKPMRQAIRQSSIWMPKKRNTWMSVVPPTSSESRTTPTSLRSLLPFCPPSPTRV